MNDKTENLERAFEYVRTFYKEVARMLSDVIDLMSKDGWDAPGGAVTTDYSYSLDHPDQWMCSYVYKNFWNNEIDSHIKGIIIFFNEHMNDFPISIVCGKLNQPREGFDRWGIYWLAVHNREQLEDVTGEVLSLGTVHDGKTLEGDIFAISLSEIMSAEEVRDKIVKKLLAL